MLEVSIRAFNGTYPTRELAALSIHNTSDHPQHPDCGNYRATFSDGLVLRIEDFDRRRGAEALVCEALAAHEKALARHA